jgi:DNA mismatch repair protein MutL
MTPDEARLALERHATSKLRSGDDLAAIASYGFRGEALPAIASVSTLRLVTRARGSDEGFALQIEAGHLASARASAAPEGTRIEVSELFASVPARRKFLKTPQTEWGHVSEWLAKVALASPGVHFDVRRDDRAASSWPAVDDPLERIAAVLGEREAASLVHAARDPPMTTVANGLWTSDPTPEERAMGMNPTISTMAVANTGCNLDKDPALTA